MNLLKRLTYLSFITIFFASCYNDDDSNIIEPEPLGDYENGVLITNEGPFGTGTGTISFISNETDEIENNIYQNVNNLDLGNIVQSMCFEDDLAFIVVNNSNRIVVVNRYTFEEVTRIEVGLNNPRFMTIENGYGYVTNWGDPFDDSDDFVAIIDLSTNTVTETISVSFGPEKIIVSRGKVYIAHKGGFSQNNRITIIDSTNSTFITTIEVGDVPNSMVIYEGDLWVLSEGNPSFTGNETNGRLIKIDPDTNGVTQEFNFELTQHPTNLTLDGTNLFYNLDGGVYSIDTESASLPTNSIIDGYFYSMTANNGKLYATDAGDFASNGILKIFDLFTNTEIQSIEVGIIPGGVYFND